MLSEKQKRNAQLSILEKLRSRGVPGKEPSDNEMNGMFELGIDDGGKIAYAAEGGEEETPEEKKRREVEEAKKKKKPPYDLDESGVSVMKSAFKKQF